MANIGCHRSECGSDADWDVQITWSDESTSEPYPYCQPHAVEQVQYGTLPQSNIVHVSVENRARVEKKAQTESLLKQIHMARVEGDASRVESLTAELNNL